MERNIRATKREMEAQNRIGGPTTELRSKLKAQTNEYKRFSNKAGLKVRDNRLRVKKGATDLKKTKTYKWNYFGNHCSHIHWIRWSSDVWCG